MRRRGPGSRGGDDDSASSRPFTSTATCRLTPLVLLPPSQPRLDRGPVSAAGTVCESMIAAVGHRSRPARTRSRSRARRGSAPPPPAAGPAGEDRVHRPPAGGNSTGKSPPQRYHRARCPGWRPLSHGGNASRVVRRGLPCCPAQATASAP